MQASPLKVKVKVKLLSRVRLFATPRTVAYQALQSMGFSRQEYWSGLPESPGQAEPWLGYPDLSVLLLSPEPAGSDEYLTVHSLDGLMEMGCSQTAKSTLSCIRASEI